MPALRTALPLTLPESIGFGAVVYAALVALAISHILRRPPGDARTSLLWIVFVILFPLLGPLAYLFLGINTTHEKTWRKQTSDRSFLRRRLRGATGGGAGAQAFQTRPADPAAAQLDRILDRLAPTHPLLGGNDIRLIEDAQAALGEMFRAIQSAASHIHLLTYILSDDATGKRLMSLLAERARAGVTVRVLYDAFGSARASVRGLFWRHRNVPNLHISGFTQASILKRTFQLNLRNHRKILVIDGTDAFTGGINFHDAYLPRGGRPGAIDYHFRIRGPIVAELQYTFLRDWYYMAGTPLEDLLHPGHFPPPARAGDCAARLQNSSPTRDETHAALNTFFAAVSLAQKQILLATPYFVPPETLITALRHAAFRGVDVKILVPAENNHPTIRLASRALYAPLLTAGVRIFERRPPFIHAKALVIDSGIAVIGSANLDPRSLFFNYETNLVIFGNAFAERLRRTLHDDLMASEEILYPKWRKRPKWQQLKENFFNLFHPIA
ncbi:MAG: cardiolipin synthase [Kiritimatiellaeota bacterium]|nr:cardiolipin synthase [Kiritimatiellota bacterium]